MNNLPIIQKLNQRMKVDLQKSLYDLYVKSIEDLKKSIDKHSFFLDKAILTISSGAIGIFFAFYKEYLSNISNDLSCWLIISFIAFCLAILFVLLSFNFAQKSFLCCKKKCDEWYHEKINEIQKIDISIPINKQKVFNKLEVSFNSRTFWTGLIDTLNTLASIAVYIGIVSGVIFFLTTKTA